MAGRAGSHVVRSISEYKPTAEEEEMRTLFTDPAMRNLEEGGRQTPEKCSHHCSCSLSGNKEKDATTMVSVAGSQKVDEKTLNAATNNIMTRRITIAGGFLDIALFTANIEQLKFILEVGPFYIYYRQVLGLIITSLVLQMLVGLTMFLLGCHVMKKIDEETYSNYLNHLTMGLVALITIVNIFIGTFGPKGTVMAMCLGSFSIRNASSPLVKYMANLTQPHGFP